MSRSLANLRDVGGLPLVGGGHTRHGVLLRSDAPYDGDAAPTGVAWPPAVVVDLRAPREWARSPASWPEGTSVVRHELHDAGDLNRVRTHGLDLIHTYTEILETASPKVAAIAGLVALDGSTLVHCAAGKDRTGIVVAALLLLAGVETDAVVTDYRRTDAAMPEVIDRLTCVGALDPKAVQPGWIEAPLAAIALVVDRLTGHPDGPRQWFLDHGAAAPDLDRWVATIR